MKLDIADYIWIVAEYIFILMVILIISLPGFLVWYDLNNPPVKHCLGEEQK